jgi:hypothetical protein
MLSLLGLMLHGLRDVGNRSQQPKVLYKQVCAAKAGDQPDQPRSDEHTAYTASAQLHQETAAPPSSVQQSGALLHLPACRELHWIWNGKAYWTNDAKLGGRQQVPGAEKLTHDSCAEEQKTGHM